MSTFGRPPGTISSKPTPPERGSFPLDHDGECKPVMADYLSCLKRVKGTNDPKCRLLAKAYLQCRMEHNLMAKDEFKNLGFSDDINNADEVQQREATQSSPSSSR